MEILTYTDALKEHIKLLNVEWLEKHFTVEPQDVVQLSDPANEILAKGGHIFYAAVDGQIVGTVTLMKINDFTYELAKMAVTEKYQGRGIGAKLLEHVLAVARSNGAKKLILYTNTKLAPAIALYKQWGFVEAQMDVTHYKRANYKMELLLNTN